MRDANLPSLLRRAFKRHKAKSHLTAGRHPTNRSGQHDKRDINRPRRAVFEGYPKLAKPDLGGKRQCQSCGTKFFDLNKDPIRCPKCGTLFQATAASRAPPRAAAIDDDEIEVDPAAADLVPVEDADAGDGKTVVVPDDDVEIEDGTADDTFLEEEEEDGDDVTGLIDGEIETDEEA